MMSCFLQNVLNKRPFFIINYHGNIFNFLLFRIQGRATKSIEMFPSFFLTISQIIQHFWLCICCSVCHSDKDFVI